MPRHICPSCGHIHYINPKVIVGCIAEWEGRILMCRRAIEPRLGLWTFPAGFLEMSETTGQGAARETLEEAQAEVMVDDLLAVLSVPRVSQVYVVHRGRLANPHHGPTLESTETVLMTEAQIPWDEIAFPTIYHSLRFFCEDRKAGNWGLHYMDISNPAPR